MAETGKNYNRVVFSDRELINLGTDNVTPADVKSGVTFHKPNGVIANGTMPNIGADSGVIYAPNGIYTIPEGYHDGTGTVRINAADAALLVAENIREGVTILGVTGNAGGNAVEVEHGTYYTPTAEDVLIAEVDFYNQHTDPPDIIVMSDASDYGAYQETPDSILAFKYYDLGRITELPMRVSPAAVRGANDMQVCAMATVIGLDSGSGLFSDPFLMTTREPVEGGQLNSTAAWCTNTGFKAGTNWMCYWRNGRVYAWTAIWLGTLFSWAS